jgi:hypothetical protein
MKASKSRFLLPLEVGQRDGCEPRGALEPLVVSLVFDKLKWAVATAKNRRIHAPVAQLDSASVFGTEGYRFESCRAYSDRDGSKG